jgi:TolA-binding protein
MADDDKECVERALASLVGVTEQSGNLRNDLRKDILQAVSKLRDYFSHVQTELEAKTAVHKELERQVRESREEIQRLRGTQSNRMGQVAPSLDETRQENGRAQQQLPPRKLFSEVAKAECMADKRYKLSVKTKSNHTPEAIKSIIKTNINPTNMKVGICAFRSQRDGRVLLETKSKEEIELLYADIKDK